MVEGRRRYLAELKERGEKVPWGRKRKNWPRPVTHRQQLDTKALAADKKAMRRRDRATFAWIAQQKEEARLRQAKEDARRLAQEQAETQHIIDPGHIDPSEDRHERAMRLACVAEQLRRNRTAVLAQVAEDKLRASGYYEPEPRRRGDRSVAAIIHQGRMQAVLIATAELKRHQDANANIVVGLAELRQSRRLRFLVVILQKRKAERFDLGLKCGLVALERLGSSLPRTVAGPACGCATVASHQKAISSILGSRIRR